MKKQISRNIFIAIVLLGCAVFLLCKHRVAADTTYSWLDSGSPGIEKIQDLSSSDPNPSTVAGLGNRDCTNKTLTVKPAKLGQAEQTTTACFVETAFGLAESNGTIRFSGAGTAGTLTNYPGYLSGIIPVPNSYDIINYSSAGANGLFLHFTRNLPAPISTDIASTRQVTYSFTGPPQASLKDKAGNLLPVQTNSLSFSSNGKWMVVDSPFKAMLRINVDTLETTPFTNPFMYNSGVDPSAQTAISSDGRYAVIYSRDFNVFKVFDLSTCPSVAEIPDSITGPVNCQSRDLLTFIKAQIPNLIGISHIRFTSDNSLELYTGSNSSGAVQRSRYSLLAPGQSKVKLEYLGLGDSYASGEGAYNYRDGTDTDLNKCHLSQISYPYLIRNNLNLNSFASVACSGAKLNDVTDGTNDYMGQVRDNTPRELRNVGSIQQNFSPGYINQLSFVDDNDPEVITISVVGNDIGFGDKVKRCLGADTCFDTYESRLEVVKEVNSKFENLVDMYTKVKSSTTPTSKIYAVGYPQVGLVGGNCGANVHLTNEELDFARLLIDYLNDTIHRAADKAGVRYIDTSQSLVGHRLCETVYSNVAVNGLTSGDDFMGVVGNESYHPNALGHRQLEQTILAQTANFTVGMPSANLSATAIPINDNLPILQVPHAGGVANNTRYDENLSNDTVFKQTLIDTKVDGRSRGLQPGTTYSLSLHSEPVNLGIFTSDNLGNLSIQFTIPDNGSTGFHTLHLQGLNIAGESIDLYKTIYVGASQQDVDGDGVPNEKDACNGFVPSGQDMDLDKIDDACDGEINEPPAPPTIAITSPAADSTASGTVVINASATDGAGVAGVQFKLDDQNLGSEQTLEPFSFSWDTKSVNNGQHTLSAVARSTNGQTSTASVVVSVQNQAPQPTLNFITKFLQKVITIVVKIFVTVLNFFRR